MIILPAVGFQASRAILEALGGVSKIAAAVFTQAVQGAVAEHAAEGRRVGVFMAGEIFAFLMLVKIVVRHRFPPFLCYRANAGICPCEAIQHSRDRSQAAPV